MSGNRLNPEIKTLEYGKREIKSVTVYPLSVSDQFKVTDLVTEVLQSIFEKEKMGEPLNDMVFMTLFMDTLKTNLGKIIPLITDISEDESMKFLDDLTNSQLLDIVDCVWTVNYEPVLKNGQNLFDRVKKVFPSKRSTPQSLESTRSIGSKISTEESIEKGE